MNNTFDKNEVLNKLYEKAKNIGAELKINNPEKLHTNRRDVLWYGGEIARVNYKGYSFILNAEGNVVANLSSIGETADTDIYEHVSDTDNKGEFFDIMSPHIDNDTTLRSLQEGGTLHIPVENPLTGQIETRPYELVIINNNWWEIEVLDSKGRFYNPEWICENDSWDDAIEELIDGVADLTEQLEKKQNAKILCKNIIWDIEDDDTNIDSLPDSVTIVNPTQDMLDDVKYGNDTIVNYLSDKYGYCIKGFKPEIID